MNSLRLILVLVAVGLLAGTVQAQVATALVAEGDAFANAPDYIVSSISGPSSSGADGWSFNCNTMYMGDTVAAAYGT